MKTLLFSAGLLLLAQFAVPAAVLDLGSAGSTPYDSYMRPVKQVLSSLSNTKPNMERVTQLMRQGRGFRYAHTDPYNAAMPAETAARHVGDCKDKALWLADQLNDSSARFVVGKVKRGAKVSHAWVMWENEGRWWILDCTLNARPIALDRVSENSYVPLYSYVKNTSFRHATTSVGLANVASRTKVPVASQSDRS